MTGILSTFGQLPQGFAVPDGDEVPWLRILRALRSSTGIEDRTESFIGEGSLVNWRTARLVRISSVTVM